MAALQAQREEGVQETLGFMNICKENASDLEAISTIKS